MLPSFSAGMRQVPQLPKGGGRQNRLADCGRWSDGPRLVESTPGNRLRYRGRSKCRRSPAQDGSGSAGRYFGRGAAIGAGTVRLGGRHVQVPPPGRQHRPGEYLRGSAPWCWFLTGVPYYPQLRRHRLQGRRDCPQVQRGGARRGQHRPGPSIGPRAAACRVSPRPSSARRYS